MTQNSHRNSDSQFEEAPLTPIGSTLTQDVFKAAAILGLAIAAVTFFATRNENPEQLSPLSYKPPALTTTQISAADVSTSESNADVSIATAESVAHEPAAAAADALDSTAAEVRAVATADRASHPLVEQPAQISTEVVATASVPEAGQANSSESLVIAPSWNVQRVGMGRAQAYRPPVVAPAIELPPMPQRETRLPRLPRSLAAD